MRVINYQPSEILPPCTHPALEGSGAGARDGEGVVQIREGWCGRPARVGSAARHRDEPATLELLAVEGALLLRLQDSHPPLVPGEGEGGGG